MTRADKILFGLFAVTLALYLVVFGTAFADLPLNVPNWHLALLLYFHFLPKAEDSHICKRLFNVSKAYGVVKPNETLDIEMEALIDPEAAHVGEEESR